VSNYTVLTPDAVARDARQTFALDVLMGLSSRQKYLPSKYFYDDAGSRIFEEIMATPEYYPTRVETAVLTANRAAIVRTIRGGGTLHVAELGAGNGDKTVLLLEQLLADGVGFHYHPIDISEAAIAGLMDRLGREMPALEASGVVSEYFDGLRWLDRESGRKLVLFLGSNIGNFARPLCLAFLRTLWTTLSDGDSVLIGFDMKKDIDVMLDAYNDRSGATERFNLNLLARINRELDADFDLARFQHHGTYNVFSGAMESYLVSLARQTVHVGALGKHFAFDPYEPVHVEYSFKYLIDDIHRLAGETGYAVVRDFTDDRGWFVDSLWKVVRAPIAQPSSSG
jgi:L-histidine Nalpha-methyltransferase